MGSEIINKLDINQWTNISHVNKRHSYNLAPEIPK